MQEPFVQQPNTNFFISLTNDASGVRDDIRLTGLYKSGSDWVVQQFGVGGTLTDPPVPSPAFNYHISTPPAETPDANWTPTTTSGYISNALMTEDVHGDMKIFAVHGAAPDASGTPVDQAVVQWYVIDPDLAGFGTSGWAPFIEEAGRLDAGGGDYYLPAICVNQQGVAFIEFTYSDGSTWPQIRRATLDSTYTTASQSVVRAGPPYAYDYVDGSATWAGYADSQANPGNSCDCWSVHTLVHDNGATVDPVYSTSRDVWLIENAVNCGNANLNFDPMVDVYDMALFNSFYAAGARRVDMNVDGTTDATDAAIHADEYDKATGP